MDLAGRRALAHTILAASPGREYTGRSDGNAGGHHPPAAGAGCVESLRGIDHLLFSGASWYGQAKLVCSAPFYPGSPGVNMYETFATEDEQFEDPAPCAAGPVALDLADETDDQSRAMAGARRRRGMMTALEVEAEQHHLAGRPAAVVPESDRQDLAAVPQGRSGLGPAGRVVAAAVPPGAAAGRLCAEFRRPHAASACTTRSCRLTARSRCR